MRPIVLWMAALGAAALAGLHGGAAFAEEPSDTTRVLAIELFHQGRALLAQGRYAEACSKLEESQRLDPGGGTLLNLALCHELQGRTATAWSEFYEALAVARRGGREDREDQAQRHIDALEPRLVRLTIVVPAAVEADDPTIRLDGNVVPRAAWGSAIPIDPGTHVVDTDAPGRVHWQRSIEIKRDGGTAALDIPPLEGLTPRTPVPILPPSAPALPARSAPYGPPIAVHPATGGWQRPLAVGIGALGFLGMALGAVFSLEATAEWHDAQPHCVGGCDDVGYRVWSSANQDASHSTLAFALGGAAIAGGLVVWWTAPGPRRIRAASTATCNACLTLEGVF